MLDGRGTVSKQSRSLRSLLTHRTYFTALKAVCEAAAVLATFFRPKAKLSPRRLLGESPLDRGLRSKGRVTIISRKLNGRI